MIGKKVKHSTFGNGVVTAKKAEFVEVDFGGSLRLVPESSVELIEPEKEYVTITPKRTKYRKEKKVRGESVISKAVDFKKTKVIENEE